MCITSTDMPVLGGNHPETCFYRYGGTALKNGYVHEMSLRLVMHAVASAAAKFGREARPMMCCSIDFYVRCFVRIYDAPARVKHLASKMGVVHQCVQCESFFIQAFGEVETVKENNFKFKPARVTAPGTECPECHGQLKIGGPLYIGALHDADFAGKVLEACDESNHDALPGVTSWKKVTSLATTISEEHADLPLHYQLPHLCKQVKVLPIPLKLFRGTLASLGYRVSHFHREPSAIKTDAPNNVVFDLVRFWAEEHPPKNNTLPEILKKEMTLKRPLEWKTESTEDRRTRVARFLPNPEKNWGPKPRARGGGGGRGEAPAVVADTKPTETADVATDDANVEAPVTKKQRSEGGGD